MSNLRLFVTVFPWLALALLLAQLWAVGSLTIAEGTTAAGAAILGGLVAHAADALRDRRRERREDELRFLDVRRETYAQFNKLCRDLLMLTQAYPDSFEPRHAKIQEAAGVLYQIELIAPESVLVPLVGAWDIVRPIAGGMAEGTFEQQSQAAHFALAQLAAAMRADVRPPERG